jgi:hypothetical protein
VICATFILTTNYWYHHLTIYLSKSQPSNITYIQYIVSCHFYWKFCDQCNVYMLFYHQQICNNHLCMVDKQLYLLALVHNKLKLKCTVQSNLYIYIAIIIFTPWSYLIKIIPEMCTKLDFFFQKWALNLISRFLLLSLGRLEIFL